MTEESSTEAASLLTETRRLLRRSGLHARKGLGQHFLIDRKALQMVVSAAELTSVDTVVEVGPGLGILTRELASRAGRVIAVELDDKLAEILKQDFASSSNVTVVNDDILKIEPEALLERKETLDYKVVANLPYYITSPVLRHFLEAKIKPRMIVVMVQKEVAQTIVAEPGDMSILSVAIQYYGKPKVVGRVPAKAFYPAPEVDSAVLRIDVYPRPAVAVDEKSFFELVRAGFSAPRKQLVNSLAQGLALSKAEVLPLLEKSGIMPQQRAEALTLEEWSRLWQALSQWRESNDNSPDAS